MAKKSYEELLAENKQLLKEKKTSAAKIKELETQVSNFGADADKVEELKTELAEKDELIEAQNKLFDELKEDGSKKKDILAIDKKDYKILAPKVRVGAKVYKTEELGAYPEIFKQLLKTEGQRIVELVESK